MAKHTGETILKEMEDHRNEFIVIVGGYDELMQKFIDFILDYAPVLINIFISRITVGMAF